MRSYMDAQSTSNRRLCLKKVSARHRLTASEQANALRAFHRAKQQRLESITVGNKLAGDADFEMARTMDLAGLQAMLPDVDPDLLKYVYALFDGDGDGRVTTDEFLLTFALLVQDCDTPSKQVEACFQMFDSDRSGTLSRSEFESMMRFTLKIDLQLLLSSQTGEAALTEQLAKEYASENIEFWTSATQYASLKDSKRAAAAERIVATFIREGAPKQVNLPHAMQQRVLAATQDAPGGEVPPQDLFADCLDEIFVLMEQDTCGRLRDNPELLRQLAMSFFDEVDGDGDGERTTT